MQSDNARLSNTIFFYPHPPLSPSLLLNLSSFSSLNIMLKKVEILKYQEETLLLPLFFPFPSQSVATVTSSFLFCTFVRIFFHYYRLLPHELSPFCVFMHSLLSFPDSTFPLFFRFLASEIGCRFVCSAPIILSQSRRSSSSHRISK